MCLAGGSHPDRTGRRCGHLGDYVIDIEFHSGTIAPAAVARAAHRYTDTCFVDLRPTPDGTHVTLTPKNGGVDVAALVGRFRNDALDEQLRATVREETGELHAALVAAALCGARQAQNPGLL